MALIIAAALLFLLAGFVQPTTPAATHSLTLTPHVVITHHYPPLSDPLSSTEFSPRSGSISPPSTKSTGYTLPLFKIPSTLLPPRKKKNNRPPHYVKYWAQNKHNNPHHQRKNKNKKNNKNHGWKMVRKESVFSPGYLVDLTERVLDGIGFLPEFSHVKNKNKGWAKHGKYVFKGITMHHGLYTSVL